jgi:outer membrane protein OmpA-like peptidoglycan-associated protein
MAHDPRSRALKGIILALVLAAFAATPGHAQFSKLKQKAKQATDQAVDKTVDDAVNSAASSPAEPAPAAAPAGGAPAASTEPAPAATTATATPAAGAAAPAPAAKEWANYDFVPGNKVLLDVDFTEDKVGNFPQRLEFKSGQLEVVELDGVRMLKASDQSELLIPLPAPLPDKYTVEIDFISKNGGWGAITFAGGNQRTSATNSRVDMGAGGIEVYNGYTKVVNSWYSAADQKALPGTVIHARFQGDGKYLKVYANEKRLANIPNAAVERANQLYLSLEGADGGNRPVYVTRIRVAETQATLYDALSATGRWSTQGILFDTGKSDIKPESSPTLKEIAAALKGHADLKVEIQGHTDNVGRAADNQALSDARAAAVKTALVGQYAVSADQLTTKGYGDTKPLADNKTAEGRQNNRRVELVKM